ncbi:MAG TPA: methyltransferase domain-containing protein [Pirellulales bacterium]|nr:methyltransferase domain-containing protein [Pirellulales bacterium]
MNYLDRIDYQSPDFADFYDELPLWSARFGLMLLDRVDLRPGAMILDVGAGTGFLSIELAQRCGAETRVIAVDPWAAAIDRLNRKVARLGIQNIRTVAEDIAKIDLPDESVDLIVSNLGVNNFDDPAAALRACFRVAKPGARLYLTTNLVGHMSEFYEAYRSVLIEQGDTDRLAALDEHVNRRANVESVRALLEQAGFEFIEAVTWSFRERFVDGAALLRHYFIRLAFVAAWRALAPPGAVEMTFAALEQRLNAMAAERGEISLTVPAACIQARKPAIA